MLASLCGCLVPRGSCDGKCGGDGHLSVMALDFIAFLKNNNNNININNI